MSLLDAFTPLTTTPAHAQRFSHWLSSGDGAGLDAEISGRTRRFVNADPSFTLPPGEREEVVRNRFQRPDGTTWEHVVATAGEAVFYAQRLARADGQVSGSLTVATPDNREILIWLDAPKAPSSPVLWQRAYQDLLGT